MRLRTHAFGVGTAKSGTHALASMFRIRSAHEPQAEILLRLILGRHQGHIDAVIFSQFVAQLFQRLDLELSVSQINGYMIETLVSLYPEARFVLTLRDCNTWVRSFVNHQLTRTLPPESAWHAFRELRFKQEGHPHRAEDRALKQRGLYSLGAYLSYWVQHNADVIKTVPARQLFIVPTHRLVPEAPRIAEFLGIDPVLIDTDAAHAFRGSYVRGPFDEMDDAYVAACTADFTRSLIEVAGSRLPAAIAQYLLGT
jgi:hypothetical protein